MKVCTTIRDFNFIISGQEIKKFEKGKSYIMSEMLLRDISSAAGNGLFGSIKELGNTIYRRYSGQDLNGKSIAIWRTGGMGDLCFITPYLKKIKELYPTSKIVFGCGIQYSDVMSRHPHIDEFHNLPIDTDALKKCDYHLMFEGIIEANPDAEKKNAYDLFGEYFHIQLEDHEKVPNLFVDQENLKYFLDFEKKCNVDIENEKIIRVGIHLKTSSIIRDVPVNTLSDIISRLIDCSKNIVIYLLGSREDSVVGNKIQVPIAGRIVPFYAATRGFRDGVAAISQMDLVIGGDSSGMHIAAAFEKPMVGLFGAFLGDLRLRYYKNAIAFNSVIKCSPCFQHGNTSCDNSDIMGESYCMKCFDVEKVIEESLLLLGLTHKIEINLLPQSSASIMLKIYKEFYPPQEKEAE
jgi:ADP-heptose:LPS heptosyltransferase